jgi:hypothetical protein
MRDCAKRRAALRRGPSNRGSCEREPVAGEAVRTISLYLEGIRILHDRTPNEAKCFCARGLDSPIRVLFWLLDRRNGGPGGLSHCLSAKAGVSRTRGQTNLIPSCQSARFHQGAKRTALAVVKTRRLTALCSFRFPSPLALLGQDLARAMG